MASSSSASFPSLLTLWHEHVESKLIPEVMFPDVVAAATTARNGSVPAYRVLPLLACHYASTTSSAGMHSILTNRRLKYDLWKDCDREIDERTQKKRGAGEASAGGSSVDRIHRPMDGWGMSKEVVRKLFEYNYECMQLLPLYKYRSLQESDVAVYNTLQYMFFHVKNGIYVKIRDGQLAAFVPFHNMESSFRNNWAHVPSQRPLKIGSMDVHEIAHASVEVKERMSEEVNAYYRKKQEMWGSLYSDEGYSPDPQTWWANAGIIDNVQTPDGWNPARNAEIKEMLAATCEAILVPDCDFFINKRDFPHLHYDLFDQQVKEPYPFLFRNPEEAAMDASSSPPLTTHAAVGYSGTARFAPIFSLAVSSRGAFADLLLPLPDDWKLASGKDADLVALRSAAPESWSWSKKKNQLIWRGSATGLGVTPETNQRLALVKLAQEHSKKMDCKLTGLNLRDRVNALTGEMEHLQIDTAIDVCKETKEKTSGEFAKLKKKHYMSFLDQCAYKYWIYVQGHSAAFRYGKMMFSNSLILKVDSTVMADKLWFFAALRGYSPLGGGGGEGDNKEEEEKQQPWQNCDHIVVKSDLSDLVDVLEWCELHDDVCQQIARNAYSLALQIFTKETIMQYLHNTLVQVNLNRTHFITEFLPIVPPLPSLPAPGQTSASATEEATPMILDEERL